MKYRLLGSSGLSVSRISLGTMTFGAAPWGCDEAEAHAILKAYLPWFNRMNYERFASATGFQERLREVL